LKRQTLKPAVSQWESCGGGRRQLYGHMQGDQIGPFWPIGYFWRLIQVF